VLVPSLSVEEVSEPSALVRYADEWRGLAEHAPEGGFFLSWEWVSTWLECFRGERPLVILLVREGTRLVGVLPLLQERRGFLWRRRCLVGAVNNQSPRAGLLCEGETGLVFRALLDHLRSARRRLRLLLPLHETGSQLSAVLPEAARGFGLLTRLSRRSPLLRIEGDWDAYLETRSTHVRREWRRKRRRLEERGSLKHRVVTDPRDIAPAMADVLEIERHSWKEDEGTSFTAETALERFYLDLACRCAERGWLRLHLLHLDGKPVAHAFAVLYRSEMLAIKTSYDQRFSELSPGVTLMLTLIERACAEGATAVDFLGAESRWKAEMANDIRTCFDSFIFTRGLPDCEVRWLLERRVKPLLRRHAPVLLAPIRRLTDDRHARAQGGSLP
jgi:CelD/BcsL family acetyltransferase involved in cellulose biosynthesis